MFLGRNKFFVIFFILFFLILFNFRISDIQNLSFISIYLIIKERDVTLKLKYFYNANIHRFLNPLTSYNVSGTSLHRLAWETHNVPGKFHVKGLNIFIKLYFLLALIKFRFFFSNKKYQGHEAAQKIVSAIKLKKKFN